jgi:decaprenylphospho-beta-D-ribofuranose 2-oxidase
MKTLFRTGWGRNVGVKANLMDISNFDQRQSYPQNSSGLAIGLGRSYGDSSLNSSGLSWSSESLKSIEIDRQQMVAVCGAGVTMGELERVSLKYGLFPKVVPGTEFVTVGGAVASNIHGKSHQRFGSFGDQLLEISLLDAEGIQHPLNPQGSTKKLFWATVGGMGLTGAIVSAKISLMPVETAFVTVAEARAHSLVELLAKLQDFDAKYQYTVAWIDLSGRFRGRGIVSGANPTNLKDLPEKFLGKPLLTINPRNLSLPDVFPSRFINRFTVATFNLLWFYKPLKSRVEHLRPFLHPLDSLKDWNRVYGKNGFLQYQIIVPFGQEDFIHTLLQEMQKIDGVSFLGVLKSFGDVESNYLSFAEAGWTLALDVSAANGKLLQTLDRLDKQLIKIEGKVYLTKDSRLSRIDFEKMYPEYQEWLQIKKEIDPNKFWQSEQGIRLGLC